jgi:ABC-type Fe3+-hydroxamate transport system substrate-binding protein
MRRHPLLAAALALALSGALAACGTDDDTGGATAAGGTAQRYEARDAKGVVHRFDRPVTRIACLQTGCDEALADLGLVPVASWLTPEVARYPVYFGSRGGDIALQVEGLDDLEALAATRPDVIYVREGMEREARSLRRIAPVYTGFSGFETGPEQHVDTIRDLGALTGRREQAEAAVRRWEATLREVREQADESGRRPPTVLPLSGYERRKYAGYGRGSFFCNILERNRLGRCALEPPPGTEDGYAEFSAEAVLRAQPEVVHYMARTEYDERGPEARTDPVWRRLSAVREGRVHTDGGSGIYCCGLREPAYTLRLYAHHVFGGPDPGPYARWRP